MQTIDKRLYDMRRLLDLSISEYQRGDKQYALNGVNALIKRLQETTKILEAVASSLQAAELDGQLHWCGGECGHVVPVTELVDGACPDCGSTDGVLLAPAEPTKDKWTERDEAPLVRPQGHAVRYDGWMV